MAANVKIIPPREVKPDILRVAAYCRVSSDSSATSSLPYFKRTGCSFSYIYVIYNSYGSCRSSPSSRTVIFMFKG